MYVKPDSPALNVICRFVGMRRAMCCIVETAKSFAQAATDLKTGGAGFICRHAPEHGTTLLYFGVCG